MAADTVDDKELQAHLDTWHGFTRFVQWAVAVVIIVIVALALITL